MAGRRVLPWLPRERHRSLRVLYPKPDRARCGRAYSSPWPALRNSRRWPGRAGPAPLDRSCWRPARSFSGPRPESAAAESRFHGGVISGASLLDADHRILHIHLNLVDVLAQVEFVLPDFEQAGHVVRLRRTVTKSDLQVEAGGVVRKIPARDLRQQVSVAPLQVRQGPGRWRFRSRHCWSTQRSR